jgi:hypothetical protein
MLLNLRMHKVRLAIEFQKEDEDNGNSTTFVVSDSGNALSFLLLGTNNELEKPYIDKKSTNSGHTFLLPILQSMGK